jgi:hypothetical protein
MNSRKQTKRAVFLDPRFEVSKSDNPYIRMFAGVVDGGKLLDRLRADADVSMATSRDAVAALLIQVQEAHDWYQSDSGFFKRDAGTPFRGTRDRLEVWLERHRPISQSVVYIVGPPGCRKVKIGYASDFATRLTSLQIASPEKLIVRALIPGTIDLERDLHKRFAADRIRGEWFRHSKEIAALIAEYPFAKGTKPMKSR